MKLHSRHNSLVLPTYMAIFQVTFIILMGFFATYKFDKKSSEIPDLYASTIFSLIFIKYIKDLL